MRRALAFFIAHALQGHTIQKRTIMHFSFDENPKGDGDRLNTKEWLFKVFNTHRLSMYRNQREILVQY